jgi:hypothetical protein
VKPYDNRFWDFNNGGNTNNNNKWKKISASTGISPIPLEVISEVLEPLDNFSKKKKR